MLRKFIARCLFISVGLILSAESFAQDRISLADAIQQTMTEMQALWREEACEGILVKKKGYPLASIACSGNFDKKKRAQFLDVLFRHNFSLEKESYKLYPQNGTYLYKAYLGRKVVYFKLYVRDAVDLWPKTPVSGKEVALYVQNVRSVKDIVRWRTLGVPLTFGVTLGRSDTAEILQTLREYGEELWLAIPLEDASVKITDGNLLTIADALDTDRLADYLSALDDVEGFTGVSPLYCSLFCKHVPALRSLLTALREKNEGAGTLLLDTSTVEGSSFYDTGRIMDFRTYRAFLSQENTCSALRSFLSLNENNVSRIISVDAADLQAFECVAETKRSNAESLDFVRVSQMSPTSPFR